MQSKDYTKYVPFHYSICLPCLCLPLWKWGFGCYWGVLQERHLDPACSDVSRHRWKPNPDTNAGMPHEESWGTRISLLLPGKESQHNQSLFLEHNNSFQSNIRVIANRSLLCFYFPVIKFKTLFFDVLCFICCRCQQISPAQSPYSLGQMIQARYYELPFLLSLSFSFIKYFECWTNKSYVGCVVL